MLGIDSPLPLEPELARFWSIEVVLHLEAHVSREVLRALPHEQMVVGVLQDGFRHERWGADSFDRGHSTGALRGTVHAAGVELDDSLRVRKSAVADAHVERIELREVHSGDERVEDVLPFGDHAEGEGDSGLLASVLVHVAVSGGDHHRLYRLLQQQRGRGRQG